MLVVVICFRVLQLIDVRGDSCLHLHGKEVFLEGYYVTNCRFRVLYLLELDKENVPERLEIHAHVIGGY